MKKTSSDPARELEILIRARYPLLVLHTAEEERAQALVGRVAKANQMKLILWSVIRGLHAPGLPSGSKRGFDRSTTDPELALTAILERTEPALFLLKDFHPYLKQPSVVRRLREAAQTLKGTHKTILLVSPSIEIPPELEKEVTLVDLPLPELEEMQELVRRILQDVNSGRENRIEVDDPTLEKLASAALGLALIEAENVFAKTLVLNGRLTEEDIPVILSEKEQIIRRSGLLDYYPAQVGMEDVGGLDNLKQWLSKRAKAFTAKAREFGLPPPKGVLLLGVQGCGKSLTAKAASGLWRVPLLRLDLGRIFGSLVGASEENIRQALSVAESVAPCILWVDEIEKGLSGTGSSDRSDAGTTSRVFGTFITWLQEKDVPVFVMATANDISALPPELLRKGRFDEIFFVDLPGVAERREIFRIHIAKRGRDPTGYDLDRLAEASAGFSGAEIEEVVVSALFDAFDREGELTPEDILRSMAETRPLSRLMRERIQQLRRWAEDRTRRASSGEVTPLPV